MTLITVEVVGYTYRPCGPFPCDAERSCGLETCFQKEKLSYAFPALADALKEKYGDKVSVELVALDKEIPDRVKELVRVEHPPLPIILVNGKLVPIGAVSVPRISECIDSLL
ncbi:hypothetical protein [Methanorbis rubei]|uniref:Uncharacterized protein n=1 Tax=Methanorbis rubei TaxID=3028300 RepID=A0AAE4MEY5_9EURY|nr:hypothetical protein [Methanocorpusculaceae archaeon Cs1]